MRCRRIKVKGLDAVYHCMTRTVNGEFFFEDSEKEVLRKMLWQLSDFCGVELLTYCILGNHFHVLVRVPFVGAVSDAELMRRYRVLYPKPTQYQAASVAVLESELRGGGEGAEVIRRQLLARMGDVSEFMKAVKQRFSVWYNRSHGRYGTLWSERFKSVLVEGAGNALQTMAAYIDLNAVRAGLVRDPKDYRFCGYAEAVAGAHGAKQGLVRVWSDCTGGAARGHVAEVGALRAHRLLLFGKGASPWTYRGQVIDHAQALKVLGEAQGQLPKAVILRCRVRYFTDGAILGSAEFVRSFALSWIVERARKHSPKVHGLKGCSWGDLAVIRGLRRQVFG